MGKHRGGFRATIMAAAATHPEAMRRELAPHIPAYCEMLVADLKDRECTAHRTALIAFPQIMGAIGGKDDLVTALLLALGVKSQDEMQKLVGMSQQAMTADDETTWRNAEAFAQQYRREHGLPPLIEAGASVAVEMADDGRNGEVAGA